MRTLYLIRHAKSSWEHAGLRDFDRPLNNRGLHDAPRMAQLLAASGLVPDLLVSSPAKRAISTAAYFAEAFGISRTNILQIPGIYESQPIELMRIVSGLPPEASKILLFGHNPTFTDFANWFTDRPIENIPTCGIVRIDSEAPDWRSFYEENANVVATWFPKIVL